VWLQHKEQEEAEGEGSERDQPISGNGFATKDTMNCSRARCGRCGKEGQKGNEKTGEKMEGQMDLKVVAPGRAK